MVDCFYPLESAKVWTSLPLGWSGGLCGGLLITESERSPVTQLGVLQYLTVIYRIDDATVAAGMRLLASCNVV